MNKKGFLDMSFSTMFAIIIGGFILFGAIYGLNKFTSIEQTKSSAISGAEFGNILSSFETSSESAVSSSITFPLESRINLECVKSGKFGRQEVVIDEYINNAWSDTKFSIALSSNYVFSENFMEGKNFYIFSKPLKFPFKISNIIYLTNADTNYCFINSSRKIRSEIKDLKQSNLFVKECIDKSMTNICFEGGANCDIEVDYKNQFIIKDDETVPFDSDALMYAAIFADKETYECGVMRLMTRAKILTELYFDKTIFLANKCPSSLSSDLGIFKTRLENYETSKDLKQLISIKQTLDSKNKYAECKLW